MILWHNAWADPTILARIKRFSYDTVARRAPITTINDATRFATIIAQANDNLKALTIFSLHGKSNDHDPYLDVFEIIFMAVLNRGIPWNTTLRKLLFLLDTVESRSTAESECRSSRLTDEDINSLSTVLATNTGLEYYIHVDGCMMLSTKGQNSLMNAVRDNSMFTRKSSVLYPPNHSDKCHYELQRSIHNQIVINKFWKKFNKRYNKTIIRDKTIPNSNDNANSITNNGNSNGNGSGNIVPNKAHDGRKGRPITIDRRLYPAFLEKLTGQPQFLFQSLKSESPIYSEEP